MAESKPHLREFADALARLVDERPGGRTWLGAQVGVSQSAVTQWCEAQTEPGRDLVFAAEKALGLSPGALSKLLGYLPVGVKSARTVLDAIDADPRLSEEARRLLRAMYETAVRGGR